MSVGDVQSILFSASVWVLPALLAITLHEAAHGYAADLLGDDTARRMGRISMNPLRHIDPFGTVVLPALLLLARAPFLFGFAKPVPVDFRRLRHPRRDMMLVALAGPGMNLVLAQAAAFLYQAVAWLPGGVAPWAEQNLENAIVLNVVLAVFNLLPIPPLDGGRVAVGLLPYRLAVPFARLEPFGIFIVLGVMVGLPWVGRSVGLDLDVFRWLIGVPANAVIEAIVAIAGWG